MKRRTAWRGLLYLMVGVLLFAAAPAKSVEAKTSDGKVVVVLDPGHDYSHGGGQKRYGGVTYKEGELNLEIAKACKATLEKYQDVVVYLTHETMSCPNPGSSRDNCLVWRADFAKSVGADIYVSLHNNDGGGSGAEVYYPNRNYWPSLSDIGWGVGDKILAELTALGLRNGGLRTLDSMRGERYPDGSRADHYRLIQNSKKRGIASVIVEHAYMSSASDVSRFLSSADKLWALGEADARGIAAYFGLKKEPIPDVLPTPRASYDPKTQNVMYRLYNPNSGEHFYTASQAERYNLVQLGWQSEGIGWYAPKKSNTPVYRLYNPNAGDHHYTVSVAERDWLVSLGWNDEGIGWYSDDQKGVPLYRQYNPNAVSGAHNYTVSKGENDYLVSLGWHGEGIGWFGLTA